uniref:Retinoic acid receptor responder protein 2 n=1 Tax=Neogobius melanostomus TaxID=47308 RepID=A0A8C6UAM7_9GOBI
MMAAGLLLFFGLLCLAGAQDPYNDLPVGYRRGVDLALEKLSSHTTVHHHFRFLRTLDKSGFGVKYLYQHFLLKPTRCAKGTTDSNPQRCPFRNDRPLMDCAVCYKTASDQIEPTPKPYVHCIQKPRVTEEMMNTRTEHCKKMTYNSGAPTLLAVGSG